MTYKEAVDKYPELEHINADTLGTFYPRTTLNLATLRKLLKQ